MEPKRTKYDTNPLDERVADRAHESFERNRTGGATEDIAGETRPIARSNPETSRAPIGDEAPTRRIDDKVTSYPSIFVPPTPRASVTYEAPRVQSADIYQPPPAAPMNVDQSPPVPVTYKAGSNKVSGLGIPDRWAPILPDLP